MAYNSSTTCSGSINNTSESAVVAPQALYLNNDKLKLSKKEGSSRSRSSRTSSPLMKNKNSSSSSTSSSQRKCAFARKCARLVKEQRARFYIMRRCVIMLICWHEYNDS